MKYPFPQVKSSHVHSRIHVNVTVEVGNFSERGNQDLYQTKFVLYLIFSVMVTVIALHMLSFSNSFRCSIRS